MLLFIVAVPLALLLSWVIRARIRTFRRARYRRQAIPGGLLPVLTRNVRIYSTMPAELQDELHGHVNVFLREKNFVGCAGLEITDEIRFTIAAYACMLLLNRPASYFPGFSTIFVYPDTYSSTDTSYDGHVAIEREVSRSGESWHRGPIVLSWADVLRGAVDTDDGYNVVLHEFAHKLDEENDGTNGLPMLHAGGSYEKWASVLSREYASLEHRVAAGDNDVLDEYALTSPAEFFAVATESFFEKPAAMKNRLPELYEQLQHYYQLDPASWRQPAISARDASP